MYNGILCVCVVNQTVMSNSLGAHGQYTARLPCPWDSPGKSTGVGSHFLSMESPYPGMEAESLAFQADYLSFEPSGKPHNGILLS